MSCVETMSKMQAPYGKNSKVPVQSRGYVAPIFSALLFLFLTSSVFGGAFRMEPNDGNAMHDSNYSAWWSPIDHKDGTTYLAYLDDKLNLIVSSRSSEGTWTSHNTGKKASNDPGHTQQSLALDGDGYIHIFWGMHNHPMQYLRSKRPADVSAGFDDRSSEFKGSWGGRYTYANVTTAPNGDVYLIIRDRSQKQQCTGNLYRWNNKADTWAKVAEFAGEGGYTVYPNDVNADADGNIHIIWEWAQGGPGGNRHAGCYVKYVPKENKWYKADGTDVSKTLPLNRMQADQYWPMQQGEQWNKPGHQSAVLQFDGSSNPIIAYSYSPAEASTGYTHKFARWTGRSWTNQVISEKVAGGYKPWMSYTGQQINYYCGMGERDLFIRVSRDNGNTWSSPKQLTTNQNVKRPIGTSDGRIDYIYMPCDNNPDKLYLGILEHIN